MVSSDKENNVNMYESDPEGSRYVHVDYVASKVSFLYEKIRQVIDYHEEHLLRENAIERSIRRHLLLTQTPAPFARDLIEEMIRGGYFANDTILNTSIVKVQKILDRYTETLRIAVAKKLRDKNLANFLYGIASCEIEEFLDYPSKELLLLEFEYATLKNHLRIFGAEIGEDDKEMLLFIAINQTLLRADQRRIYFRLMQKMHPEWFEKEASEAAEFLPIISRAKMRFESLFHNSALKRIKNRAGQFAIIFQTLSDISGDDPQRLAGFAEDPQELSKAVGKSYTRRFNNLRTKLKRAGFRSVLSIFFGKILIALAIEVPAELLFAGQIIPYALMLSIIFPPSIMLFAVLSIRMPSRDNLQKLIGQVSSIMQGAFEYEPIEITNRKRSSFISFILTILYILTFAISFGGVIAGLNMLHFNVLSIIVFWLFLSLIIFSAMRIKQWARELNVGPQKEGFGGFFLDIFTIPIVGFGKFLSGELSRFNILVLLFNLFFEAPFQSFVQFIEEWRRFIREKKEEL